MSFFKKTNWFGVAMVEMGIILFFLITTFVPPMTPLEKTRQRMITIERIISYSVYKHGKVQVPKEIQNFSRNYPLHLDGWGTPIQYTVTNNVVTLICHIKGNENQVLMHRFSIEGTIEQVESIREIENTQ